MVPELSRRFASLILTLVAVSAMIYGIMDLLPGDPASIALGTSAASDTLATLRQEMGLDLPLPIRYVRWVSGLLSGDFGTSDTYGVPVAGLVLQRLSLTLPLAILAVILSVAIAVPLGVAAAARRNGVIDHIASVFAQASVAIPGFWLGLLLIMLFAVALGWAPAGGFPGWKAGLLPCLGALSLPAVALALPQAGVLTRVTRSAVLDVLNEDFVRTARAKGLPRNVALWRHAVPNALIPVVTVLGLQFTFLVAGAVLVENVFSLPGLGRLAYQALMQRDVVVMQAVVLLFCTLVIVVNFIVDITQVLLDPRMRRATT